MPKLLSILVKVSPSVPQPVYREWTFQTFYDNDECGRDLGLNLSTGTP